MPGTIPTVTENKTWTNLSEEEEETVLLVMQGLSNKEIGAELHLAESTIKKRVTVLTAKLGVIGRPGILERLWENTQLFLGITNNTLIQGIVRSTPEVLTEKELKLVACLLKGMTNKEIAYQEKLAESTVRCRLSVLYDKVSARDRTEYLFKMIGNLLKTQGVKVIDVLCEIPTYVPLCEVDHSRMFFSRISEWEGGSQILKHQIEIAQSLLGSSLQIRIKVDGGREEDFVFIFKAHKEVIAATVRLIELEVKQKTFADLEHLELVPA